MKQQFVHLHLHGDGSLLDGMNDLQHLISRLKEIGHGVVGLTDHGNMHNALAFYKRCVEEGIKPIIGCEFYMFHDHTLQKKSDIEAMIEETGDDFIGTETHLVVLAKNFKGYQSLSRLSSLGFSEGFYRRPHIDFKQLFEHKEGLIVIEGHVGTTVAKLIERGDIERAYEVSRQCKEVFGEDFYLEIQDHGLDIEQVVNPVVIQMSRDLDVKLIASTDAHYTTREDAEAHRVLFANGIGMTYEDFMAGPYEGFTTCEEFYVKSDNEMFESMFEWGEAGKQAVLNTMELADKCNIEIPYMEYLGSSVNAKGKTEHKWKPKEYLFPNFTIPVPFVDASAYVRHLANEGLEERLECEELFDIATGRHTYAEYKNRLDFELDVITKMGFPAYFLIIWDALRFCREKDIPVGKGRGSGAGSLVLYSLRVTDVDPLQYNLLFERFLSVDRISLPDVDLDFCMARVDEVLEYIKEKYGREYVAKIGTFGTLGAKAVLKDVARVLSYPFDKINGLTRQVTDISISIEKMMDKYADIKTAYETEGEFKKVVDIARRLEGLQRHSSKHAAGLIISPFPLADLVPTKGDTLDLVSQYSMEYVELLGLVKMDFLKLRTLTIVKNTVKSIEQYTGEKIDVSKITFDDPAVFEEFQKGNSTGIFQFESDGMKALLRNHKPRTIDDLAADNALYRPGPLDMKIDDPDSPHFGKTMVDVYVARASGESPVEYDHPLLEEVQKDTYGVFVFQEQVMKGSVVLAKYTKAESDELRKVVGKKIMDKMPIQHKKFVDGCLANDEFVNGCHDMGKNPVDVAENIWKQIETFGRYGFNAAHSYSYAILAYISMWLKVYYPTHFMAAVLTSWMGAKVSELVPYLNECRRMGIQILPPDVNQSSAMFVVSKTNKGIHFGLTSVKGVGTKAVENILEIKATHAINSLVDFIALTSSSVNKTVVGSLIKAGAFDFLGFNRKTLLKMAEEVIEINSKIKTKITNNKKRKNPVADISSFYNPLYEYEPTIEPEFSKEELCQMERELTGFYMANHPLDGFMEYIRAKITHTSTDINLGIKRDMLITRDVLDEEGIDEEDKYIPIPKGQTAIIGGVIKQLNPITIKNGRSKGKQMATFIIEDTFQGDIKCTAFAETYTKFKNTISEGNVVFIKGAVDYYRENAQINVNEATIASSDVARKYVAQDNRNQLADIEEQIANAESILDILGTDDYDMVGAVCEELILLYDKRDELTKLAKEEAYIA
jgi:DNA polymerase-3 subunit alpha